MIELQGVTKYYPTSLGKKYVFKDLNFSFPEKSNIGVLGLNGSGKTTLLRMIGGIDFPNKGSIKVRGSISWPLGLAGGTQGSLSGRENSQFICRVYGDSQQAMRDKLKYIKEFSELDDYFDLPVKTYSSGMRSRLLFGISMAFDFDTFLIDEVTAVGDARFRKKCQAALEEKRKASNYIMVSHNTNDLIESCDSLLVLDAGKVSLFKDIDEGLGFYNTLIKK